MGTKSFKQERNQSLQLFFNSFKQERWVPRLSSKRRMAKEYPVGHTKTKSLNYHYKILSSKRGMAKEYDVDTRKQMSLNYY